MTASPPTDFGSVDGYYQPEGGGLLFSLSPVMVSGLLLLLVLAAGLGWWLGQRRAPSDDPCETIYDDIRKTINTAAGASRDSVMIAGRKLNSTIDDRLGAVLKLAHGIAGPVEALDLALEGLGQDDPGHEESKPDPGPPAFVIHARRDVTIHTAEAPRPEAHDDQKGDGAHDDPRAGPGHSHGSHGGHAKPIDARTQVANVRAAVHDLSDHWNDKPKRLAELRAARRQLTNPAATASSGRVWERR